MQSLNGEASGLVPEVLHIATLRYCANWFRSDEFATATGLTLSASAVGGLLATTPLAVLVATLGWRTGLFGVGLIGFGVTAVVLLTVRDSPREAGLDPIEGALAATEQTLSQVRDGLRAVLSRQDTWLMGCMLFFATGTNFTILGL